MILQNTSLSRLRSLLLLPLLFLITPPVSAEEPIRIGVLASLTGNWAEICKNFQEGILMAGEEMNERGGANGRKFTFDFQDTDEEKSGARVVTSYKYLRGTGIKLFIGPSGVPGILALTPIAKNDDIVLVQPTATGSYQQASENFFNAGGDNAVTTIAAAKRLYELGSRRVAIFGTLQPWEEQQGKTFNDSFSKMPGASIAEAVYPLADEKDLRLEALRVVKSNPDGVFFAIYNNVASAASALKRLKYAGRSFASSMDDSHLTGSEGGLEGTEVYLFSPPSDEFKARYQKRWGRAPGLFADTGYDAALALILAVRESGTDDPAKVRWALRKIQFQGSSGETHHFESDRLLNRGITLYEVKDGATRRKPAP